MVRLRSGKTYLDTTLHNQILINILQNKNNFKDKKRYDKINNQSLLLTIDEKEDTERTLRYYQKYGSVIRLNYITIDTTYYKTIGGMQAEKKDRKQEALQSAIYLQSKYPLLGTLHKKKKSKHPEFKLKDQTETRPLKERLFDNLTRF